MLRSVLSACLVAQLFAAPSFAADINVGILLSATGPAAAIGNAERNGTAFGPAEIAGKKVNYLFLDEASDATAAVSALRKLHEESKIDLLIGPTTTPGSFAVIEPAVEYETPMITLAPVNALVAPIDARRRWVFKTTTNDDHEATPLFANMKKSGVKKLALIGFGDSYGDAWSKVSADMAKAAGIELVANEKYARTDTTVVGQILKILAAGPDAVLIAASGAPAALPLLQLREKGYDGQIYGTLGATFGDFKKLTGAQGDGIFVPLSPAVGAASFPDEYPAKKSALEFIQRYEAKFGPGSRNIFAGTAYDALLLLEKAAPIALKTAEPGTPEFRQALRGAIESLKGVAGSRGVYNYGPDDHTGLDQSALVLGKLEKGEWVAVR
ncbi:ABC transporter substrate-binding protein [Bradyrhizobium viridifuturi]|jgi:branched-chain amino acid transport system substrate-binding protein|nr:ABC transporter substrate-binding protein [uncultured Bradyrhizobium sp.]ERF81977.1 MAG: branched-chain amino acid transport system substrate-binding protein [Bradyrhizobium sp. DFCI-1]MBR1018293.1 ABC transporter substrate-binding protein [Bradyrhizobium viridifuturi]MCA3577160.1 ABC transporter substrate-binding protein [Bradyrhizobium sp.]MCA3796369.1 ABC transporter substrate-binding protein [Burkholderia sp.]OYU64121.1 MAG: branched-chain amino acid ABC transporter substrate-binding pr